MNRNPFEPPQSEERIFLERGKNSIFWKVFFFISAMLMVLALLGIAVLDKSLLSVFDYIDIFLSLISITGLFGFAFYKSIGNVVFWRYFFYAVLLETIIYNVIFPMFGVEQFGAAVTIDIWFIPQVICCYFFLFAMHSYAYRCPFIWDKS